MDIGFRKRGSVVDLRFVHVNKLINWMITKSCSDLPLAHGSICSLHPPDMPPAPSMLWLHVHLETEHAKFSSVCIKFGRLQLSFWFSDPTKGINYIILCHASWIWHTQVTFTHSDPRCKWRHQDAGHSILNTPDLNLSQLESPSLLCLGGDPCLLGTWLKSNVESCWLKSTQVL